MSLAGSSVLLPPCSLETSEGRLAMAVVTSPCRNVVHSIINTSEYTGKFLPGFQVYSDLIIFRYGDMYE